MTPDQKSTIASILSVDLATLDSDRLIELCVIYRAAPDALDTFPAALNAELVRRYSSEAITSEDVNFAVLQHMANQFQSAIPYFHLRLLEMAGTVNRDIWFADHEAIFRSSIDNAEVAAWLIKQPDILNKCLGNRLALGYLAQSTTAATAILTREEALALWKNAPALWDIWPQHAAGMQVLAKSGELIDYLFGVPAAVTAVQKQLVAIRALATHAKGVQHMATPAFMKTIIADGGARDAVIGQNEAFQSVRSELFKAISASGSGWTRTRGQVAATVANINALGANFATPAGLLFARFSRYGSGSAPGSESRTTMKHPDGSTAAAGQDNTLTNQNNLNVVDGISFNGATFQSSDGSNYCYAELWTPTP